jgi:hypothetical protein
VSGSPWNSDQDCWNSRRNWLIRASLTPYLRAVFVAFSPLANVVAMLRFRLGRRQHGQELLGDLTGAGLAAAGFGGSDHGRTS